MNPLETVQILNDPCKSSDLFRNWTTPHKYTQILPNPYIPVQSRGSLTKLPQSLRILTDLTSAVKLLQMLVDPYTTLQILTPYSINSVFG